MSLKESLIDALFNFNDAIISLDRNFIIVFVNKAQPAIFGLTKEMLLGKCLWDVAPHTVGTIMEEKLKEALLTKQKITFEWTGAYSGRLLKSTLYPSVLGVTVISTDITDLNRAQEELKEIEGRFRIITNNTTDPIYIKDRCSRVIMANHACQRAMGKTMAEIKGKNDLEIYADQKIGKAILQTDKYIMDSGKTEVVEEIIDTPEGQRVYLSTKTPYHDDTGNVVGIIGISRDITVRKQAEKTLEEYRNNLEKLVEERTLQLKDTERLAAIGATAGMVGHDIRNPLQSIVGEIYLLNDVMAQLPEGKNRVEMKESLESISANVNYINKIVADLQDFSRQIKPEYSNINLYELITNVFQPINLPSNLICSIDVNPSWSFKSDSTLLRRILTNLTINAIQAMEACSGKLCIIAFPQGDSALIIVEDNGIGIPEYVKSKLFTPMVTTKSKGQGLGLAVVKRLVEALGGTIGFESEVGKGTKFIISLPFQK